MTKFQKIQKRTFDLFFSVLGLLFFWWLILLAAVIAYFDTKQDGFFRQIRIGKDGAQFKVLKIRTMRPVKGVDTTVTTDKDPRISKIGRFWRKTKLDELPQLWNVLVGNMSFVGPRPDVPGFADALTGDDRIMLTIRPGITGAASLVFKGEENILANLDDPEKYNREVIWPEKVRLNIDYINNYSLLLDVKLILKTIFG